MKNLKLTAKEWLVICEALDRKAEDFENYSKEELNHYIELKWRVETLDSLTEKLRAINPNN